LPDYMCAYVSRRLLRASNTERMTAQCIHAALSEGLPSESLGRFAEELYMNEVHTNRRSACDYNIHARGGVS
jgi:hypothetical protein